MVVVHHVVLHGRGAHRREVDKQFQHDHRQALRFMRSLEALIKQRKNYVKVRRCIVFEFRVFGVFLKAARQLAREQQLVFRGLVAVMPLLAFDLLEQSSNVSQNSGASSNKISVPWFRGLGQKIASEISEIDESKSVHQATNGDWMLAATPGNSIQMFQDKV